MCDSMPQPTISHYPAMYSLRLCGGTQSRTLPYMIIGGLVSMLTGLIMILWPGKTLLFVAALIGAWLLIAGIIHVIQAFTRNDLPRTRRAFLGLAGLLYIVIAAVCFRDLFTSLALLT